MIIICDLKLLRCSLYKHHCLFLTLCCQTCWISLLNVVSDCYNLKNRSISFLSFLSLPACCQLWKSHIQYCHIMTAEVSSQKYLHIWLCYDHCALTRVFATNNLLQTQQWNWLLFHFLLQIQNSDVQAPESKQCWHTDDKFMIFYQSTDMQQI